MSLLMNNIRYLNMIQHNNNKIRIEIIIILLNKILKYYKYKTNTKMIKKEETNQKKRLNKKMNKEKEINYNNKLMVLKINN